ncbi:unnamed protein product [Adineta ricciae]|uniref:Uncharacterized protein n=1 Tax=Adineta ricciae TaxID=249248 RepID=A0A814S182_ADIRI|nr:unnamed protein product [Adineta ricciae]CAF1140169.1 unnamed protein product [Adineta ricciae]
MLSLQIFSIAFLIEVSLCANFQRRQSNDENQLRYAVGLAEPFESTLEWDYDENDETQLILLWNITIPTGQSGLFAFSTHDLNTNYLDMIIFGSDEKLYSAFSDENSLLTLDGSAPKLNYVIRNRVKIDGGRKKKYSIQITRPLDTCDQQHRNYIIDHGTTHILTGLMSSEDFQNGKQRKPIEVTVERMKLTLQRVQLLKSQVVYKPVADSEPHLDFLNQNVHIPSDETTYWCTRFELPRNVMAKPHHIIRFDGVISPQSEGIVHHMELFHCDVDPSVKIPAFNDRCTSEQKPMGLTPCRRVIGAWAMGAENFTYPDEAGGVIGGPKSSRFLVLEVHFNNPYLKKGIIDQSGIRIYYTPQLRKYDAGIMEVGLEYNPKNSIPPGASSFRISGYCASECTKATLPRKGITVFASQLHTHQNGVQTFTRLVKKSGEIETLNVDRHYSPHFQEIRILPKSIQIERGDTILHTCIYNTEIRTNMTFGGYGISDEMCVNYMHYYPRSELELCKTSVRDDELDKFFETMKQYDFAKTSKDKTVFENYWSIRWTPLTTSILETFYELAPFHLSCNGSDGNYSPNFDWRREYIPQEPKERDVPFDTASKCIELQ